MNINNENDVLDALRRENMSDRMLIGIEDIKLNGLKFCENMTRQLNQEIYRAAIEAQKAADWYWDASNDERENPNSDDCYIGTRVRLREGSIQLEWYRNRTITAGQDNPSGPRRVMSTYIRQKPSRKGGTHEYSMLSFKNEPEWAKELIGKVEGVYKKVRKRVHHLQESKRQLKQYRLLLERELNEQ